MFLDKQWTGTMYHSGYWNATNFAIKASILLTECREGWRIQQQVSLVVSLWGTQP